MAAALIDERAAFPRTLLDLPTELLKHIINILHTDVLPEINQFSWLHELWRGFFAQSHPLNALSLVNRRLRNLCLPGLFQVLSSSMVSKPIFPQRILPVFGEHITHAVFYGNTRADAAACLFYLLALPNLSYLYFGRLLEIGGEMAPPTFEPFRIQTAEYTEGEAETATALRAALRRVQEVVISHRGRVRLDEVLASASGLRSLTFSGTFPPGTDADAATDVVRKATSLRQVHAFGIGVDVLRAAVEPSGAPWPLDRLSCCLHSDNDLNLVNLLSSTLRSLQILNVDEDLLLQRPSPPLFTTTFPHLHTLDIHDGYPFLLNCAHLLPNLRSLSASIPTDIGEQADTSFLQHVLPTLFRSLPSLRHFYFDFNTGTDMNTSTCLSPSVSARLVQLCFEHGIALFTKRLFAPIGAERESIKWYQEDCTTVHNSSGVYFEEKAEALLDVLGKASDLVRHAKVTKDERKMDDLLELVEPIYRRLLVEQGKGVDRPGMGSE